MLVCVAVLYVCVINLLLLFRVSFACFVFVCFVLLVMFSLFELCYLFFVLLILFCLFLRGWFCFGYFVFRFCCLFL